MTELSQDAPRRHADTGGLTPSAVDPVRLDRPAFDDRGPLLFRVRGGSQGGRQLTVRAERCTIGTSAGCTIRVIGDGVAPIQCLIVRGRAVSVVRRWGAETRLNGRPFDDAVLKRGDRLDLPGLRLEFLGFLNDRPAVSNVSRRVSPAVATTTPAALESDHGNDSTKLIASGPSNGDGTPVKASPSVTEPSDIGPSVADCGTGDASSATAPSEWAAREVSANLDESDADVANLHAESARSAFRREAEALAIARETFEREANERLRQIENLLRQVLQPLEHGRTAPPPATPVESSDEPTNESSLPEAEIATLSEEVGVESPPMVADLLDPSSDLLPDGDLNLPADDQDDDGDRAHLASSPSTEFVSNREPSRSEIDVDPAMDGREILLAVRPTMMLPLNLVPERPASPLNEQTADIVAHVSGRSACAMVDTGIADHSAVSESPSREASGFFLAEDDSELSPVVAPVGRGPMRRTTPWRPQEGRSASKPVNIDFVSDEKGDTDETPMTQADSVETAVSRPEYDRRLESLASSWIDDRDVKSLDHVSENHGFDESSSLSEVIAEELASVDVAAIAEAMEPAPAVMPPRAWSDYGIEFETEPFDQPAPQQNSNAFFTDDESSADTTFDPVTDPIQPAKSAYSWADASQTADQPTYHDVSDAAPLSAAEILRKYGLGDGFEDADRSTRSHSDAGSEEARDDHAAYLAAESHGDADEVVAPIIEERDDKPETSPSAAHTAASTDSKRDDAEESVSEYMQQLLQRMRSSQPGTTTPLKNPTEPVNLEAKKSVPTSEPVSKTETHEPMAWSDYRPRTVTNESKDDLDRMREIANDSAREAVTASRLQYTQDEFQRLAIVTAACVVVSLVIVGLAGSLMSVTGLSGIGGLVLSAWLGSRTWKSRQNLKRLLIQTEKRNEETLDHENQRRAAKRATPEGEPVTGSFEARLRRAAEKASQSPTTAEVSPISGPTENETSSAM